MSTALLEWMTLVALTAILIPIAISNFRDGLISNGQSLSVLGFGVFTLIVRYALAGHPAEQLHLGFWALATVGLMALIRQLPAGVIKLLIAMLPCYAPDHYFFFITGTFVLLGLRAAALVGVAKVKQQDTTAIMKRDIPFLLPLLISHIIVTVATLPKSGL